MNQNYTLAHAPQGRRERTIKPQKKMTIKRPIKSHKGGRTADVKLRIKPEIKKNYENLARIKNVSKADLLEEWIIKENNKLKE